MRNSLPNVSGDTVSQAMSKHAIAILFPALLLDMASHQAIAAGKSSMKLHRKVVRKPDISVSRFGRTPAADQFTLILKFAAQGRQLVIDGGQCQQFLQSGA